VVLFYPLIDPWSNTMNRYSGKREWSMRLAIGLAFAALAPMHAQAQTVGTSNEQDGDAVPSDADLANTSCTAGEERFLPGDYYYCLGTQTYGNKHYANAQKFFTTAASWASKPAQYVLGIMALNGDHQPVNRPLGLAWLTLASERSNSDFKLAHDTAYKNATAAERSAAEELLKKLRPTYADSTAAVRAERRYVEGMAELTKLNNSGGSYCMRDERSAAMQTAGPTGCPPAKAVMQAVDTAAVNVFDGWVGHVQVGPLEQAGGPSDKGG
jgi:hypothetical protein